MENMVGGRPISSGGCLGATTAKTAGNSRRTIGQPASATVPGESSA